MNSVCNIASGASDCLGGGLALSPPTGAWSNIRPSQNIEGLEVPGQSDRIIRFAGFEMDLDALQVKRNGVRIPLQIQPFRVLAILVEHAGEVVTRDELRAKLWSANVFVDFDHGLNNAIARLRDTLQDSAENPRFIETLPRVGYRFVYTPVGSPIDGPVKLPPPVASPDVPFGGNCEPEEQVTGVPPLTVSGLRSAATRKIMAATIFGLIVVAAIALIRSNDMRPTDGPIRSIAVLPFRDLSQDGGQEHVAAGMTEALVTSLAQNQSVRVVSRRAGEKYRDAEKSTAEIAIELQVDGVIDSSILRQGDDVRVDVQLIRASDDSHAWAQSYHRSIEDIFLLQNELADDIGNQIAAGIAAGGNGQSNKQASIAHSDHFEAYELYLQGRHVANQRNPESLARSQEYFVRAIELDSGFAAAYAGLADAYVMLGGNTLLKSMPTEDARAAAMAAARRGIELDDNLAEAHAAMANVLSRLFPRSAKTDAEIEQEYALALKLNPANASTRHAYGGFLSVRRRSDEAIAQFREALVLEPLSPNFMGRLGMELTDTGQIDEGVELMQRAIEIEPWQFNAHIRLGWTYAGLGRYQESQKAFAFAEQISPGSPHTLAGQAYVAARSGDVEGATAILANLKAQAEAIDAPFLAAIVYVGLQDKDGALEWLEKAANRSNETLTRVGLYGVDAPIYDWLRDDPRFARIRQLVFAAPRDTGN